MSLKYSSKHDISYANYNNKNIPWKLNTSYISQNNQITNLSPNLGNINNNLVIESSQNNIVFDTSQNKKVIVKNNMSINANLDVSNNLYTKLLNTKFNNTSSVTSNNRFYFSSLSVNIIGDLKVRGAISILGSSTTGLLTSKSQFINVTLSGSSFTDVSIVTCDISVSDFSNVNIINSYIYNIPIGYDKSNNVAPNKAIFSDVSLQRLILDNSINSYISFANNSIIIRSSDDYSKLEISKPLNIGIGTGETISNTSIFYGDISCNTLYYSHLVPDIRLNTYFDISIGEVSVLGNIIPTSNMMLNIGSTNYKFNEIHSTNFNGDLSGTATLANDLVKNLDMSFNTLDIYGTITLNKQNLNQFLSGDLISIIAADISFTNANNRVRDLSINLNTNFTKVSLLEASFSQLNNRITSISNTLYSKSNFDLCLNRNFIRTNDVSAIPRVVSSPGVIYPTLGYNDSFLNKVNNTKVVNELAFPYAITYIDDITEDTNIKESLARIAVSQDGSIVASATAIGVTYELNINVQNWEWHRTNAISSGRSLAVILNATQNEQARVIMSQESSTFIGGSRKGFDTNDGTSLAWEWSNGYSWVYTNWASGQPEVRNEDAVRIHNDGLWHDWPKNSTSRAVYMNTYGIGNGLLKISENNNNKSYYTSKLTNNISTSYSCIAITNDGMFVALGKATTVTVYISNSTDWQPLGSQINVDFSRYTDTCCNILWDGYDTAMYRNLQNLAINFNYNNGLTSSQLILAYGDSRTSVKVYSYTGGSWELSNGIYSVVGGNWGTATPITFTSVGTTTFTFTPTVSDTIEYLVVAGGGGGGCGGGGGGGGAGGVLRGTRTLSAGSYNITVGAGGNGTAGNQPGFDGGSSSISTLVSTLHVATGGGGGGGWVSPNGRNGGSGGGQNARNGGTNGGAGIVGQGFAGASYITAYGAVGGGGGGGGGVGNGTRGGIGISSNITGTTKYYAGGGGGGGATGQSGDVAAGGILYVQNGTYGGGNGARAGDKPDFTDAVANTGGGGGGVEGSNSSSGSGGSGIVVISYTSSLRSYNATTAEINSNNFGYFVTLSQSPSILGFTVANKFYTYNCSISDGSQRGSVQTLPNSNGSYTNIIAFKMTSDAEKIIVSNTYYVFIYKWNINNWSLLTTINLVNANIRADIPDSQITGGTIGTSGLNTIYSFTTVGTSTFIPVFSGIVQVLIVGGGGGGGRGLGGGGGGSGVVYIPSVSVSAGTIYNITVGAGGISETNGENSSAFTAIAAGGGRGGTYLSSNGGNGGCGGGAGTNDEPSVAQQGGISSGNSPGTNSNAIVHGTNGGSLVITPGANNTRSPGGGGAGAAGLNTDQTAITSGGQGIMYDILGTSYYWAGGGGGSIWGGTSAGSGGLGGGGGGGASNGVLVGSGGGSALNIGFSGNNGPGNGGPGGAGGANTGGGGGGGGGGNSAGGAGGSGIVVIRYIRYTANIPAGPRSLDISNISSNECVFAIGFPDVLINKRTNNKARGYVEYWKFSNTILTRLATLLPRKRDIINNNVDSDEYYFSGGGIKITNVNTILIAPNFKFHLNSTNKIYTLDTNISNWDSHNTRATSITGREMASIENEADNEVVKISSRNNTVWIGGKRISTFSQGKSSADWVWSDLSSTWNYTSFNSGEPNRFSEKRIEFQSTTGTWYDNDELTTKRGVYMTRLQYSLNTFNIFDKFFFHSSGFSSSYTNTAISTTVIARWYSDITSSNPTNTNTINFKANGEIVSRARLILSDVRLKENIVDASPKLVDLLKIRVVNYNLKGSKDNKLIGVIAQELEELFPTLVNDGELSQQDIYLGKTESYKSVKYSCFDVILIKAFQEQLAIINKLSLQLDEIDDKCKLMKTISQDNVILNEELDFLKRENELFKLNINEILKLMKKDIIS
jgi:hypothetical protein